MQYISTAHLKAADAGNTILAIVKSNPDFEHELRSLLRSFKCSTLCKFFQHLPADVLAQYLAYFKAQQEFEICAAIREVISQNTNFRH